LVRDATRQWKGGWVDEGPGSSTRLLGEEVLPRTPSSAPAARRLVASWLSARDGGQPSSSRADVALVVSELVTNAVLHAIGDHLHVRLRTSGREAWVVEVEDHYRGLPAVRAPGGPRGGGHGLRLLQEVASAWGIRPTPTGKIVWVAFGNVPEDVARDTESPRWTPGEALRAETERFRALTEAGPPQEMCEVRLLGLPLALFAAQLTRHRELLRELQLVARFRGHADPRLVQLASELGRYQGMGDSTEGERSAAAARGAATLDITYRLPASAGPPCDRMMHLLREADSFAAEQALLTLPSTADEVAVREWFLCEITRQCEGDPPIPWHRWVADRR
jgi:anti-sigma regulatory factor (Ser/Thr protein kinase)